MPAKFVHQPLLRDVTNLAITKHFINKANYKKRFTEVKNIYSRKQAYAFALPRIIYRRRRKKLKKSAPPRQKGLLYQRRLTIQNQRASILHKRKWKRYFKYY
jgi:hypothetical protein